MAGINYVVAPYEADAQLAYLSMKGVVDVVISEDSDTIPYGCRRVRHHNGGCSPLLFASIIHFSACLMDAMDTSVLRYTIDSGAL